MKFTCDFSFTSAPHRPQRGWHPGKLFASGEPGAWCDPADLSTLFQDVAGTVPVTAAGQPVALMRDKSGNGNHASQPVASARPIYRTGGGLHWLEFDGVDDGLASAAIDFSGTNKLSVFSAVRKLGLTEGTIAALAGLGPGEDGGMALRSHIEASQYKVGSRGTVAAFIGDNEPSHATPHTGVVTTLIDIGAPSLTLRANGYSRQTGATQGSGTFANAPLYIGKQVVGARPFLGNHYGLCVRGVASSAAEIASVEGYLAARAGVTL
jgi:hypothetical protein